MKHRLLHISVIGGLIIFAYLISLGYGTKNEDGVIVTASNYVASSDDTSLLVVDNIKESTSTSEIIINSVETIGSSTPDMDKPKSVSSDVIIFENMKETPTHNSLETMAWIYPSDPGCNAKTEYRDGRKIDILKPEFFTVNGGSLKQFSEQNSACNGYSAAFVSDLKKYSNHQYVTVSSASTEDMDIFLKQALASDTDINTLVNFVVINDLTGIELDFEDFGGWSQASYDNFLNFTERLGNKLHANNKKLMLDAPAIADKNQQTWFKWRYEDFVKLPVDYIVVMAYDYQFDHGTGEPVAPLAWIKDVISWASSKYPAEKLSIGIPSYGYEGVAGKRPYIRTYEELKNKPGFSTAKRDNASGELTWKVGTNVYYYQDSESLRQKIALISGLGINSVSVWHLGGNPWY